MSLQMPSFAEIVDPGMYSIEEAERLAIHLMSEGQRIPERFALALQGQPPPDNERAERMLELLPRIATPARLLPLLDRVMPSSNSRIRSKALKLYAAASADLGWALVQINDDDARVAANVVEALWRATPSELLREIFWRAATQKRNRVAGNGMVGLLNLDDPRAAEIATEMVNHPDAPFRATAAWAIGRACWPHGSELLQGLRADEDEGVRTNAERGLLRLAQRYPVAS
jgi:HEAT repeat protein